MRFRARSLALWIPASRVRIRKPQVASVLMQFTVSEAKCSEVYRNFASKTHKKGGSNEPPWWLRPLAHPVEVWDRVIHGAALVPVHLLVVSGSCRLSFPWFLLLWLSFVIFDSCRRCLILVRGRGFFNSFSFCYRIYFLSNLPLLTFGCGNAYFWVLFCVVRYPPRYVAWMRVLCNY